MEPTEREHIHSEMCELISTLTYNSFLTTYLEMEGHLVMADIEAMDEINRTQGNAAAITELLRILSGRPGSYASLLKAARQLGQRKAVAILEALSTNILT